MTEFSRPFNVTYPDGVVYHGVQFPSGRCVVAMEAAFSASVRFGDLEFPPGSVVEWQDGGQP